MKKILAFITMFFASAYSAVASNTDMVQSFNEAPSFQLAYGVNPSLEPAEIIFRIIMFFGLPILILAALIIGLVVFIKRKRRRKKANAKKDS
ncbi:MAG: hypothetical protein V1898_02425 [Patescibacteria group bacterium]